MIRAKVSLYLIWAHKRQSYEKVTERIFFPLVDEIEKQLKKYEKSMKSKESGTGQIQLQIFQWKNNQ
jgi:hypothetical protein